jgi:AcrR family transcriptional regulator
VGATKNSGKTPGSQSDLSVAERVEAAIVFLTSEHSGSKLSVSAVCRAAGVNRANLYSSHPDVVEQINLRRRERRTPRDQPNSLSATDQLKEAKLRLSACEDKYRSLLRVCVEQQAEINFLRLKLAK